MKDLESLIKEQNDRLDDLNCEKNVLTKKKRKFFCF